MRRTLPAGLMLTLGSALAVACYGDASAPDALSFMVVLNADGTTFPCPATPGLECVGFVGKGAVQGIFQLNNPVIQSDIDLASAPDQAFLFSLDVTSTYEYVCTWTTGPPQNPTVHTVTRTRSTGIVGDINAEPRPGPTQWTGFNLLSFGDVQESGGEIPAVGDACPGNEGTGAVVTSVTLQSSDGGGLFVVRTFPDPDEVAQLEWP